MRRTRIPKALLAIVLAGLIAGGCGGGSDDGDEASDASTAEGAASTSAAASRDSSMQPGSVKVKHPCDVVSAAEVAAILGNGTYKQTRTANTDSSNKEGLTCTFRLDVASGTPSSTAHLRVFTTGTNNALAGGNDVFKRDASEVTKSNAYELVDYPGASLAYLTKPGVNAVSRELSVRFGDALGVKAYVGVTGGLDLATVQDKVRPLADLLLQRVRA